MAGRLLLGAVVAAKYHSPSGRDAGSAGGKHSNMLCDRFPHRQGEVRS